MNKAAMQPGVDPMETLRRALSSHDEVAISFSGAEDVVLIDIAASVSDNFAVFTLDTGRLHPETYRFIDKVRDHYGIDLDVLSPDAAALEAFVREKGLFSFYEDGHHDCCGVRKIDPLQRYLINKDAWITGQRKDQSPTRTDVPDEQEDTAFTGKGGKLRKYNPLTDWSSADVWHYIRTNDLPYNELHDRGFVSIGCEPCTRAVGPGEHERAGRWWWEEATQRECGLHVINLDS